ncbi:MAG: SPOR domain-containing protein [Nitrosomonadales bacterium]|nr:SPOR domain-containing protein [Nitrosomonadales bacterium]
MSRNMGNRAAAQNKSGSSLLTGILVGMVIGAGMAAGLAWYIMKSPSPFVTKEQATAKPLMNDATPAVSAEAPVSGVGDGKPRFEFYKVLTDKPDAAVAAPTDKTRTITQPIVESKPIASGEPHFLQAGSFSNPNDAEKLKAKLALLGLESSIQTATIPDRGVWYRVRLGPYKDMDELSRTRASLKQNGVDATPMRAQ